MISNFFKNELRMRKVREEAKIFKKEFVVKG